MCRNAPFPSNSTNTDENSLKKALNWQMSLVAFQFTRPKQTLQQNMYPGSMFQMNIIIRFNNNRQPLISCLNCVDCGYDTELVSPVRVGANVKTMEKTNYFIHLTQFAIFRCVCLIASHGHFFQYGQMLSKQVSCKIDRNSLTSFLFVHRIEIMVTGQISWAKQPYELFSIWNLHERFNFSLP